MENSSLNIIIEKHVPFLAGVLEPYADVRYLDSSEIDAAQMAETDALITRTRTRCDRALLESSRCRFVGTATIGTDHIDTAYCAGRHITVANAPGCNAPAVAQYVMSAIAQLANRPLSQYTLGIVGVGHVGSIVEQWAKALDMRVLLCDPPRQRKEGGDGWSTLEEIAGQSDIITFHTPLTRDGRDATWHLADEDFFNSLRRAPIFINCARGPVNDTQALIKAIDNAQVSKAVIDCWEGEPDIDRELLRRAAIATQHIAGYSFEGKVRASMMVLDALTHCLGLPRLEPEEKVDMTVPQSVKIPELLRTCDLMPLTAALKATPEKFEIMRDGYKLRNEVKGGRID